MKAWNRKSKLHAEEGIIGYQKWNRGQAEEARVGEEKSMSR